MALSIVTPPHLGEPSSPNYSIQPKCTVTTKPVSRQSRSSPSKSNPSYKPLQKTQLSQYSRRQTASSSSDVLHRKRRQSFGASEGKSFKRRKKETIVLPTKFLLGGNIYDPLNLSGLGEDENQITPQSSPLPTPKHRTHVEVRIPANINDPLNLNSGEDIDESTLISPKGKGKRKRKRKRTESETTVDEEANTSKEEAECSKSVEKSSALNLKIEEQIAPLMRNNDKIVSPVIPQGPVNKYRKITPEKLKLADNKSLSRSNSFSRPYFSGKKYKAPNYKPKDAQFRYGNYNRYYGYRNEDRHDPRLECFKKEWFENKEVLDIGCNTGHVTLAIGRDYSPKKIVGMDIDESLVLIARRNIRHYITTDFIKSDVSLNSLLIFQGQNTKDKCSKAADRPSQCFPSNVSFVQGNFVDSAKQELEPLQYDCLLCLSVTKWIHLNWGDDGLKKAFRRMFELLRPGGILIIEPQPWSSYKKKKKMTVRPVLTLIYLTCQYSISHRVIVYALITGISAFSGRNL